MKARPLADRILIKPDPVISDRWGDEKPNRGIVIAVGRGRVDSNYSLIPVEPQVKDKVLYGRHAGIEVVIDDEEYLLIRESDILMIL